MSISANSGAQYDLSRIDLSHDNPAFGEGSRVVVNMPVNGGRGFVPQVINATHDSDQFMVASIDDYNHGLITLEITRNNTGGLQNAEAKALDLSQPNNALRKDRLNIQRAQSAVLVERDGVQYAIVSDDNYNFNDPYWKAQFEAPMFVFTSPFDPPQAIGGSPCLVAIVKKRLNLKASLYEMLQILSLTIFEKTPLNKLLSKIDTAQIDSRSDNQLNLFN